MKTLFHFAITFLLIHNIQSQSSLSVQVSTDSLLFGNPLKVSFVVENASTDGFEAPDFEGFNIVSGPSFSTSVSIINGAMSQSGTVTYWLEPQETGVYYIPPAYLALDSGESLESQPIEILVVPNPDGIRQMPEDDSPDWMGRGFDFDFGEFFRPFQPERRQSPQEKKKKDRKVYKF